MDLISFLLTFIEGLQLKIQYFNFVYFSLFENLKGQFTN